MKRPRKRKPNKNSRQGVRAALQEMATQLHQEEERKNFNHFLETGEVLPAKDQEKHMQEALAAITSLVRPGPLLTDFTPQIVDNSKKT